MVHTPINTGNAVPSADARDRADNSANLDIGMNGRTPSFFDRKGLRRETWFGMERRFNGIIEGLGWSSVGDYSGGIIITSHNQVVEYLGQPYALKSKVPASVGAPYVTTGDWATEGVNFKLVGDSLLRQDLAEQVPNVKPSAVGDGITDDTAALLAFPDGAYMPPGEYFVDTMQVDPTKFFGPGLIHSHNGQVISLKNDPIGSPYVQRRVMAPVFGGAGSVPAIYPGATNAPQGLCRFKHPVTKEDWVFISQYTSGKSWSALEYSRDTSWRFRDDGQPQEVAEISPPMNKTHAHLSTIYENNQIWMYQSFRPPADAIDNTRETGCGWSKYPWRGAASSAAELVNYRVWGRPGSGHRYQNFGKACVQVSQDGKYVIMVGINYGDENGSAGGRNVFVYDRLEVESAADPLKCEPVYASKALQGMAIDSDTAYQGETTDGRFIYVVWGSAAVFGTRGVSVYTLTGDHLRDIHLDGSLSKYTYDELRNGHPTLGICTASEPEGISLYGDSIYVMFSDNWAAIGSVVSRNGLNYVCKATTTNDPEVDTIRWTVTDLPATSGEWVPNKSPAYAPGATTLRDKTIYEMSPPKGRPDEQPLVTTYRYPGSIAQLAMRAGNLVDLSIAHGGYFRASVFNPITGGYRPAFEYAGQSAWRIRDTRASANYNARLDLAMDSRAGGNRLSTISQVGDGGTGPKIQLYDVQSPGNPGNLYIGTADIVGAELRAFVRGETRLNVRYDEIVAYRPFRYLTTNVYPLMTASRVATTVYLQTAPVVASDARLKTPVRDMSDAELAVGRRLAREPGFYKWLSSINEKGDPDARWHSGMTVQRAIEIFEDEGIDPFAYGAVCHDVWGDEFETVDAVRLPTGEYEILYDKLGNEVSREPITEEWAPAAQRQTQWAGDKFSFREQEVKWLIIKALAFDQDRTNQRLDALEKLNS